MMRIFLAGTSFRRSYGGPAVSVPRLAAALGDAGADVELWSADGSAPEQTSARPMLQPGTDVAERIRRFAPDVVHDNGLWRYHNHTLTVISKRLAIPRVVSTRGMLEPWALRHKMWKKRLAWYLYQGRDLRDAAVHHATSEQEAANLRRLNLGVPIDVVPNGIDLPPAEACNDCSASPKVALFIGRLYSVKGLPMLLNAWASIRPTGWLLRIAGPDEGGHRRELERLISDLDLASSVSLVGEVTGQPKIEEFKRASLFVLPSHSESFGIAVGEALAHGLPVLTTSSVPWLQLASRGCGWIAEPNAESIGGALAKATVMNVTELRTMGATGRRWIEEEFTWRTAAAEMLRTYDAAKRYWAGCGRQDLSSVRSN